MPKRRYEILLPLRHNDGRPVTSDKFGLTRQELLAQFGAVSTYPQSLLGTWMHEGTQYDDELLRVVIDVEDSQEIREFFRSFKSVLLERFEQLEIYIVSYPIDVI